jgi:hypothetical protein
MVEVRVRIVIVVFPHRVEADRTVVIENVGEFGVVDRHRLSFEDATEMLEVTTDIYGTVRSLYDP